MLPLTAYSQRSEKIREDSIFHLFFYRVLLVSGTLLLLAAASITGGRAIAQNAIVTENALTGNLPSEWDISGAGDLSIQGFATDISVNRGQSIRFKINTNARAYTISIYRIGYYGGRGARRVGTGTITATLPQSQPANPVINAATGLMDYGNWAESARWDVPATAVSGIYIARLTRTDTRGASHIMFIVRDDASTSACYFKTSDATWQAYNGYGGNSLYVGNTSFPGGHAAKVSYNRPFLTRAGGGGGGPAEDWFFNAEYPMVRFLERNGYDVSYTTDVDTDRRGNLIKNHKVFLSVGHDEYWSGQMRANVESARAAGVSLVFASSNEMYWKTRWEPSIDGSNTANRTLVCYKEGTKGENTCGGKCDPLPNVWTGLWREGCAFPSADGCRPENSTTGQISWNEVTGAITVPASYKSFRFWRNSAVADLSSGQTTLSAGSLGYEIDFEQNNGAYPAGRITLSQTSINSVIHKLSLYRSPEGTLVFGTGTAQWSWGLDGTHDRGTSVADRNIQQATVNILAEMGAIAASLQTGLVATTALNDRQPPVSVITTPQNGASVLPNVPITISGTAAESAGVVANVEISTDSGRSWTAVNGTTSWTYSWTPGTSANYTILTRSVDDLANLETAVTPSNKITVTTNAPNCTPPTGTLVLSGGDCEGKTIALKLSNATGTGPYALVVNGKAYQNVSTGGVFATVPANLSIWGATGSPNNPEDHDSQAIEVGTRFRSSQGGVVTGIRFFKGNSNTGTHTGSLWTSSGTKLASVVFTNETASGWQEMLFPTAVTITANTTYIVSYYSPGGGYASSEGFFTGAPVVNGPLTALQNGVDGANGLYKYGTSGFPAQSYNSSNYWVDVMFRPASYSFTISSLTDAMACTNSGNISTATIAQSSLSGGTQTFYRDADADGYGNASVTVTGCTPPAGYVTQAGDCNDNDAAVRPGLTEVCGDGKDNNCNGQTDENCNLPVAEQSIWGSTGSPLNTNDYDGTPIELGVKFRVSQPGAVTGIRFYKGSQNLGTHTGNLYSSSGALLASIVFGAETASGWQEARFTTPVSVTANTTYVAAYFSAQGRYASSENFFTSSGVTTGAITALQSGADGGNGVYRSGSTGFPASSYNASNYWVDVLFKPAAASQSASASTRTIQRSDFERKPLQINVLPNPGRFQFNVTFKNGNGQPVELRVFDAKGKLLEIRKTNPGSGLLIGQTYPSGSYIIHATQGARQLRISFIKI